MVAKNPWHIIRRLESRNYPPNWRRKFMFSHSNQNCSHHNRNRAFTRKTIATKTTTPVVRACSRLSCSDSLEFDIFAQKQHSQANRKFFQLHEYQKYLSLPSAIFFFYFFFSVCFLSAYFLFVVVWCCWFVVRIVYECICLEFYVPILTFGSHCLRWCLGFCHDTTDDAFC